MSFDWAAVGNVVGGLTTALTNAGVSATNMPNILAQIGMVANPNKSQELAICAQLLQFAANPAIEQQLVMKLVTEQGIPAAAAAVAMTLTQPGVDIVSKVLQIEQLINQGG
jgi:hypothetical protein